VPTQPLAAAACCAFSDDAQTVVGRMAAPPRPRPAARRRRAPLSVCPAADHIHPDAFLHRRFMQQCPHSLQQLRRLVLSVMMHSIWYVVWLLLPVPGLLLAGRAPLPAEAVTDPIHPDALGPHRLVTGVRSFFQAGGTITAMSRR
jgi:hypothetical protein